MKKCFWMFKYQTSKWASLILQELVTGTFWGVKVTLPYRSKTPICYTFRARFQKNFVCFFRENTVWYILFYRLAPPSHTHTCTETYLHTKSEYAKIGIRQNHSINRVNSFWKWITFAPPPCPISLSVYTCLRQIDVGRTDKWIIY